LNGGQRLSWAKRDARIANQATSMLARDSSGRARHAAHRRRAVFDHAAHLRAEHGDCRAAQLAACTAGKSLDLRPGQPAVAFAKLRFAALHAEAAAGTVLMVDESHAADGLFETIDSSAHPAGRHAYDLGLELALGATPRDDDTSGTIGWAKGFLKAGSAVAAAALGFALHRRFTPQERLLSVNPPAQVAGMEQIPAMLACGGTLVFAGAMIPAPQSSICSTTCAAGPSASRGGVSSRSTTA
jgi:fatty-acyl-CoA synthase/long-chain acyl-CoA synthetase